MRARADGSVTAPGQSTQQEDEGRRRREIADLPTPSHLIHLITRSSCSAQQVALTRSTLESTHSVMVFKR